MIGTVGSLMFIAAWLVVLFTVRYGQQQQHGTSRTRRNAIEDWIVWPSTVWVNHKDERHETPHEGIERLNREL